MEENVGFYLECMAKENQFRKELHEEEHQTREIDRSKAKRLKGRGR